MICRRHGWRDSLDVCTFIDLCLPLQMLASYTPFGYPARSHCYVKLLVTVRFYFLFPERKVKFNRKKKCLSMELCSEVIQCPFLIGSAF